MRTKAPEHLKGLTVSPPPPEVDEVVTGTPAAATPAGEAAATPPTLPLAVEHWWRKRLTKHLDRIYCRPPGRKTLEALVRLLATLPGPAVGEDALYTLLTPMRVKTARRRTSGTAVYVKQLCGLNEALPLLEKPGALARVFNAIIVWRRLVGRTLEPGQFRIDRLVQAILDSPDAEQYIRCWLGKRLEDPTLGHLFNQKLLAAARRDSAFRGLFGGSATYWRQAQDALDIIT